MSAREMFEKLGYKFIFYLDNEDIEYEKQFEIAKCSIYFANQEKRIELYSDANITYTLQLEELQAIYKQLEELGWLGGDK